MSTGSLELGLSRSLEIRREILNRSENSCRLLYISDIHLRRGRSAQLCSQILQCIETQTIDAILLGGDLTDQISELGHLSLLVRQLRHAAPVFATGGNHDAGVGLEAVQTAVEDGGGLWIHKDTAYLQHTGRQIAVSGPEAGARNSSDVHVLCAHNPRVWKTARRNGFDLVLAGHLHGCQVVAFEYRDRLYPGALFYPYCYLSHQRGTTRLVVSRGVSDLFPIRWRCPREVVLCFV